MRTPVEYREVHAADARNVPLDRLDPAAVMQARNGIEDEPLYLICRSGSRGRQACEKFLAAGFTNVVNVEGGTLACVEAGLPVVRGKKAISLERQVRIAAGSLVLLGACLGWLVHPGLPRPVGLRRGRAGLRRHHRHLRHGHDAGPDAVESSQGTCHLLVLWSGPPLADCQVGWGGDMATPILAQAGFEVTGLSGV